ncbi:hypothetical protein [Paractinoplanes ferrugineus]|nr:hypothetical protein [Actinoplanes ferrugineus]
MTAPPVTAQATNVPLRSPLPDTLRARVAAAVVAALCDPPVEQ